ncbi:MAG: glycoside hydrolase family 88 protein, partial [Clostridia bacterium]|nr:glycoside hydrolase family 88 protein [Clostridia bacterium]
MLAGRYNIKGGYIRAWNTFPEHPEDDKKGWAIIDCMMNIPLLYWASEITGDERFEYIAMSHADKVIDNFIRPDGSVSHIVKFNPTNGEFIKSIAGQGYADDSSWSRGQSWAINGFSQSYIATGEKRYLDAAKRVANYFIAACVDDALPRCDFRQPSDVVAYDSSAAAIASVGLINISNACEGAEKEMYLSAALRFLKTLDERCCPWENENDEAILNYGMERFNSGHRALIYGDYYFLEAILKLKNM